MKVYVVMWEQDYDRSELCGVFNKLELAKDYVANRKEVHNSFVSLYIYERKINEIQNIFGYDTSLGVKY